MIEHFLMLMCLLLGGVYIFQLIDIWGKKCKEKRDKFNRDDA